MNNLQEERRKNYSARSSRSKLIEEKPQFHKKNSNHNIFKMKNIPTKPTDIQEYLLDYKKNANGLKKNSHTCNLSKHFRFMDNQRKKSYDFDQNEGGMKSNRSKHSLPLLTADMFIIPKNITWDTPNFVVKALWKTQNKFVCIKQTLNIIIPQFNHANILQLYGYIKINTKKYIVTQSEGNTPLSSVIDDFGPMNETLVKSILKQIIQVIKIFHQRCFYHNNLSTKTIYLKQNGSILIDSSMIEPKWTAQGKLLRYVHFYAPQLLLTDENHVKGDIWSIGTIALNLLIGDLKKDISSTSIEDNNFKIVNQINQKWGCQYVQIQDKDPIVEDSIQLSHQALDFINKCLVIQQRKRLQISALEYHLFISK